MSKVLLLLVCVAGLAAGASAGWSFGADLSTAVTEAQFKCLLSSTPKVDYVVVRGFRSSGLVDPNAANNLKNAAKAGYVKEQLGVYIFPQPLVNGKLQDGGAQLKRMVDSLNAAGAGNLYTNIWLDVEGGRSFWSANTALNIQFFESMRAQARIIASQQGYKIGVYSAKSQWAPIVGPNYKGGTEFPIWYAQYNAHRDFGDWVNFGGWTQPLIHQFKGTTKSCGISIDVNVMKADGTVAAQMAKYVAPVSVPNTPVDLNPKCTAVRGKCQATSQPCVGGSYKVGFCSGPGTIRCCAPNVAPANLQTGPASAPATPIPPVNPTAANGPAAPSVSYPSAAQALPPSTRGRVIVEAEDTGKTSWVRDRPTGKKWPRMTMGKLRYRRWRRRSNDDSDDDS